MSRVGPLELKAMQDTISELLLAFPELAEDEVLRSDMIEAETPAFDFLSKIVRNIGAAEALQYATAAYIKELQARKDRFERREYALRGFLLKVLHSAQLSKAELPEATVTIRAGTPKVVIVNEDELPQEYLRVKYEPDKTRIKEALMLKQEVPGATLSNAEPVVAIKVK
jgi:hypothetical protein